MSNKMTIREFQNLYQEGHFKGSSRSTQIEAGWVDWFCPDSGGAWGGAAPGRPSPGSPAARR